MVDSALWRFLEVMGRITFIKMDTDVLCFYQCSQPMKEDSMLTFNPFGTFLLLTQCFSS
jgi:hypothetical protein